MLSTPTILGHKRIPIIHQENKLSSFRRKNYQVMANFVIWGNRQQIEFLQMDLKLQYCCKHMYEQDAKNRNQIR